MSFDVWFAGEAQDGLPGAALQFDCRGPVCAQGSDRRTDGDVDDSPSREAMPGPQDARVPHMATGTAGTPAWAAATNAPMWDVHSPGARFAYPGAAPGEGL